MRAMEPMLFVMVTSVARARSSFVTVFLRSVEFICPKLQDERKRDQSVKEAKEYREPIGAACTCLRLGLRVDQMGRNRHRICP